MPDHTFPLSAPTATLRSVAKAGGASAAALPRGTPFAPLVDRQLAECRRGGTTLAVLSIGFDGLEEVGQRHGHAIESQLQHAMWNRLRSRLRASDLAVCIGAGEFGAILVNAAGMAAAIVDARVSEALSQPYGIGTLEIAVRARTGVAVYPQAGSTGEGLVAAALRARALRQGRTPPVPTLDTSSGKD